MSARQLRPKEPLNLGIVSDEFFERKFRRMGGFGWAARQVARFFNSQPELGVRVVFLAGRLKGPRGIRQARAHDTPLIFRSHGPSYRRVIRGLKLDLILSMDYRPSYYEVLKVSSPTPTIVWVRDPKPPEVTATQATLRIPGNETARPQGIKPIDYSSFDDLLNLSVSQNRLFCFATPASSLSNYIGKTYGAYSPKCFFLPNIVDIDPGRVVKPKQPRVIFLGRLDPIKRPWVFVELARRFPQVEFLMLGKSHFRGDGSWAPGHLPKNVKLAGHVDGEQKRRLLSSAWVLVNTSIHEGLPTSFLESLACETPLLACTNQDNLVSRFGVFAGLWDGDGMDALPQLEGGLQRLLENRKLSIRLGQQGRAWVEQTHSGTNFLAAFDRLCITIGLQLTSRRLV